MLAQPDRMGAVDRIRSAIALHTYAIGICALRAGASSSADSMPPVDLGGEDHQFIIAVAEALLVSGLQLLLVDRAAAGAGSGASDARAWIEAYVGERVGAGYPNLRHGPRLKLL